MIDQNTNPARQSKRLTEYDFVFNEESILQHRVLSCESSWTWKQVNEFLAREDELYSKYSLLRTTFPSHHVSFKDEMRDSQLLDILYLRALRAQSSFPEIETRFSTILTAAGEVLEKATGEVRLRNIPRDLAFVASTGDELFNSFTRVVATLHLHGDEMPQLQRAVYIRYIRGRVEQFLQTTKDSAMFLCGRHNIANSYLTFVRDSFNPLFQELTDMRISAVELLGAPGIGKSRCITNLKWYFCALCPLIPRDEMVYVRSKDRFWNGYKGQPILLYDDVTHADMKKSRVDYVSEIIDVCSGAFQNPPMAFVKDMPFCSTFCAITSNVSIMKTCLPSAVGALKRRVDVWSMRPVRAEIFDYTTSRYRVKGSHFSMCVNTEGKGGFSVLDETIDLHQAASEFFLQFEDDLISDTEGSASSTTSIQTSSVPESYSEITDVGAFWEDSSFSNILDEIHSQGDVSADHGSTDIEVYSDAVETLDQSTTKSRSGKRHHRRPDYLLGVLGAGQVDQWGFSLAVDKCLAFQRWAYKLHTMVPG